MTNKTNNLPKIFTPSVLAVLFMVLSGIFATSMHCLIRFATEENHPFEVAFFRTIFVLLIFLPFVVKNGFKTLKPNNIKLQSYRAIIGSVAMLCMFYGLSITFWQAAGLIPATFILATQVWQWPNLDQLIMFLLIAIAGTLTHWFLNEALKRAEISALLPLDYLRLIWSVSLGLIFFNEIPPAGLWLGAALILGASTYIGVRQAKKKKDELNTNTNISI